MIFEKKKYLTILIAFIPIVCFAQGIQEGFNDFLFLVFGVVIPSIVLLILFLVATIKNKWNLSVWIYILSLHLGRICIKYLDRNIYLYRLRSDTVYLNGSKRDMSDEISMILVCSIGLIVIATFAFFTIKTHLKHRSTRLT